MLGQLPRELLDKLGGGYQADVRSGTGRVGAGQRAIDLGHTGSLRGRELRSRNACTLLQDRFGAAARPE
jgi:hypothetical protein